MVCSGPSLQALTVSRRQRSWGSGCSSLTMNLENAIEKNPGRCPSASQCDDYSINCFPGCLDVLLGTKLPCYRAALATRTAGGQPAADL